jgi:hypothetical protein
VNTIGDDEGRPDIACAGASFGDREVVSGSDLVVASAGLGQESVVDREEEKGVGPSRAKAVF